MFRVPCINVFRLKTPVNLLLRNLSKTIQNQPSTSNPIAATQPTSSQSLPLAPISTEIQTTSTKEVREIQIPVPWGHISGKWWGPIDKQPMLCIHGWKDNAATFDKLIPLLNVESLLAVDLPGHGKSSPYPIGDLYNYVDEVVNIRRIAKHYQWEKFAIMGHSFGSCVATGYAACFPESVSLLIQIDCTRGRFAIKDTYAPRVWKNMLENYLTLEKVMTESLPQQYAYDDIVKLFAVSNRNEITIESSNVILSRGVGKAENGKYFLTSDPRLRLPYFGFPTEDWLLAFAAAIKCEVLAITASERVEMDERETERIYQATMAEMEKVATRLEHHYVEGKHYAHLDAPVKVAEIVNRFLSGEESIRQIEES